MAEMINEDMIKIGERIRNFRMDQGMSQAELAEKADISLPHLNNLEHGKKNMRIPTLIKIAEALQVTTDSLLRPDIPEVTNMYKGEFADVLKGCTNAEIASITRIVKEIKSFMRSKKEY